MLGAIGFALAGAEPNGSAEHCTAVEGAVGANRQLPVAPASRTRLSVSVSKLLAPGLHRLAPALDATATYDEASGGVVVLAVNRSLDRPLPVDVDLRAVTDRHGAVRVVEHQLIADADPGASNTEAAPDRVVPRAGSGAVVQDGRLRCLLPPMSWNVIQLAPTAGPPTP